MGADKKRKPEADDGKKAKKAQYHHPYLPAKPGEIKDGMRGILFTVNGLKDKQAIYEIKNLMTQYLATTATSADATEERKGDQEPTGAAPTVSSRLGAELGAMKTEGARYAGVQVLDTLVKGNYFVEVKAHDPRELVLRICADFCDSSAQSTRFMYRMIPIHTVCRAHVPTIKEKAKDALAQYTTHMKHGTADSADLPRKRFMVNTKVRNNTGLEASTEELKKSIAGELDSQLFSIDLQFPDVVVFVYALNSAALIGIGEDVTRLRSFNIHELATQGPMPAEEIDQKRSKRDASIAAKTKANGAGNAPEVPNEAAGAPPTDPSAAPVVEPSGQVTEPSATMPDSAALAVDPSAPCTHHPAPAGEPSTTATETPAAAAGSPIQGTDPSSPVTVPSAHPTESTNPPSTSDKEHFPGPSETCLRVSEDQADASTGAVTPVDHPAH
eukprot:TRINITY_DN1653_c0_g1_i2.p1 TRINITY_DN1653_c0_g1~~TRINITY_DN1653_c0_g1_i2.p1  ORF type:complete len:458 (-),score=89.85 TRINITY_DN1653_c0_g1_i2:89-1414(-)